MKATVTQLAVHRRELMRHELRTSALREPEPDEITVKVELFGLSANNVTYVALGNQLRYFDFFPLDADWSALPVWGVGSVIASQSASVALGTRLFGFFPAASHATLKVATASGSGVRAERPAIGRELTLYNQYSIAERDPLYLPDREELMVVMRPLLMTGLALADYLVVNERRGADIVVVSSAASKTSYGLAAALKRQGSTQVVGLASAASLPAAAALAVYDRLLRYDELASLDPGATVAYIDVAGDASLRQRLAAHPESLLFALRTTPA
jgi:hypothetical protein